MTRVFAPRGDLLKLVLDPTYRQPGRVWSTPWVHGAPGWGKSVFARQLVEQVRADGGCGMLLSFSPGLDNSFIFWRELLGASEEFYRHNPRHMFYAQWTEVQRNVAEEYGPEYRTRQIPPMGAVNDLSVSGMLGYISELSFRTLAAVAGRAEAEGFNRLVIVVDDVHHDADAASCVQAAHERARKEKGLLPVSVVFLSRPPFEPVARSGYGYSIGPWLKFLSQSDTSWWLAANYPDLRWSDAAVGEFYATARGVPWLMNELAEELAKQHDTAAGALTLEQIRQGSAAVRARLAERFPSLWEELSLGEKYYLTALAIHADENGYTADQNTVRRQCDELVERQSSVHKLAQKDYRNLDGRNLHTRGLIMYRQSDESVSCVTPGLLRFVSMQKLPDYYLQEVEAEPYASDSGEVLQGNRYP